MTPTVPRLEFLTRGTFQLGAPLQFGRTNLGERRIVPILGGTFEGRLNAEIIPGSADWQVVGEDGAVFLEARYNLRTPEGVLIYVRNVGVRHGPPEVIARMFKGEIVDPSEYYLRTTPTFETGDSRYRWLNTIMSVASGARTKEAVVLDFYEVK